MIVKGLLQWLIMEPSGITAVVNHGTKFESIQPNPILYTSHNTEAELLWNKKMLSIGKHIFHQRDTECHIREGLTKKSCSEQKTIPMGKSKDIQYHLQKNVRSADVQKIKAIHALSPDDNNPLRMKERKAIKPLRHPSGWLRSAPVAVQQQCKHFPNPKLNRTSLLRRAKLDPQLAHQMHAEIQYQVKQHQKHLGESFEAALAKIKSKKILKEKSCKNLTVGCQTEDNWGGNVLNLFDFQKGCTHVNGMRKNESEVKRHLTNGTKLAKLQAGSNVVLNEHYKEDFELSTDSDSFSISKVGDRQSDDNPITQTDTNANSQRPSLAELQKDSKESFELYDDSESINISKCIPHTDMTNSQERSPSLSVSVALDETEQKMKGQKPTCRITDGKEKTVETKTKISAPSKIVREQSEGIALTYTIHENLVQENTFKVMTCESNRQFNHNEPVNSKHNPSTIEHLRPADNTVSFQTSEVSEASKLSSEIVQEILKEKEADFFVRNGSQLHVSEKIFLSTSADNKLSKGHFTADGSGTCSEEFLESSTNHNETTMISENGSDCRTLTSYKPIDNTKVNAKSVTQIMSDVTIDQGEGYDNGGAVVSKLTKASSALEDCNELMTASIKSISQMQKRRESASSQEMDDFVSSISDISARIAALLMPNRVSVAQLNTDSVSSYVPSDVSDTLSCLSDMAGD